MLNNIIVSLDSICPATDVFTGEGRWEENPRSIGVEEECQRLWFYCTAALILEEHINGPRWFEAN